MKNLKLVGIGLSIVSMLIFSGCSVAGYQGVPNSKKEALDETLVEYDQFKKQTLISTPPYLIRDGFTDKFPVIVGYKSVIKDNKIEFLQMYLQIMQTEKSFFNQAVGHDGYEFKFEDINPNEEVATISTTSGNYWQYSSSMTIKKEIFTLFFTLEQLKKMSSQDYSIKIYGKTREGKFVMPKYISEAFLLKILESIK